MLLLDLMLPKLSVWKSAGDSSASALNRFAILMLTARAREAGSRRAWKWRGRLRHDPQPRELWPGEMRCCAALSRPRNARVIERVD